MFVFTKKYCLSLFNYRYSRKILWLKVGRSNNNPKIIGGYFLDFLKEGGLAPFTIRMDAGTENVLVQDMQTAIRNDPTAKTWIVGKSTANQVK